MANEIWSFLRSPEFWLGGLIAGLLVNLASSYIRDGLDRVLPVSWKKTSGGAEHSPSGHKPRELMTADEHIVSVTTKDLAKLRARNSANLWAIAISLVVVFATLSLFRLDNPDTWGFVVYGWASFVGLNVLAVGRRQWVIFRKAMKVRQAKRRIARTATTHPEARLARPSALPQ